MPRPEHAVGDSTNETCSPAGLEIDAAMHDRSGDLLHDPRDDLDEEEVWFDAEALAAASTVDLAGDPDECLQRASVRELADVIARPGISLARLPGWPRAGAAGQGLGAVADELIGELRPGDLVLLGARERGVGRTSLLAQLGDGLALASGEGRPATPVLFVVEGPPALWRARSLGRWFDLDPRVFIEGERARQEPRFAALLDEFARGPWAGLDARQRFVSAAALIEGERRSATVAALRRWRSELDEAAGPGVWPIVIIDPLEQLGSGAELLAALGWLAGLARDEGLIVLGSCDLDERDADRTRAIDSFASVRLGAALADEGTLALELCHRRIGPRSRGRLRWQRASGRFEVID